MLRLMYLGVFVASLVLSSGGIILYSQAGQTSKAGRGGALAVAISLFALFNREDYSARHYKRLLKDFERDREIERLRPRPAIASPEQIEAKISIISDSVYNTLTIAGQSQLIQSLTLGTASFIGTIAWGFGDIAAVCLLSNPPHWLPSIQALLHSFKLH